MLSTIQINNDMTEYENILFMKQIKNPGGNKKKKAYGS